jgi:hypothetical protein
LEKPKATASPYDVLKEGIEATIAQAKRSGVKRILIIGPPPEFPWDAPYCVMRSIRVGVDSCTVPRETVETRRRSTLQTIRQAIGSIDFVRLIDPIDLFCTSAICSPHDGRTLFFSDTNHLSMAGAERLYQKFENEFRWALTGIDADR